MTRNEGNPARPPGVRKAEEKAAAERAAALLRLQLGAGGFGAVRMQVDPTGQLVDRAITALNLSEPGDSAEQVLASVGVLTAGTLWQLLAAVASLAASGALCWAAEMGVGWEEAWPAGIAYHPEFLPQVPHEPSAAERAAGA